MLKFTYTLLLLCCLNNYAIAKDMDGDFVVFSVGANNCGDYINARKIGGKAFENYEQWLMGYLSAFNLIVINTYDILGTKNYKQVLRWLDKYCGKKRREPFVNAAARLTMKLYPSRRNMSPNKNTKAKWKKSGNVYSGKPAPQTAQK